MKVLIVDSDPAFVEGLKAGIDWKQDGLNAVYEAVNISVAKRILTEERIDIMICDVELSDENGIDLLKWIKKEKINTIAIYYSNRPDFSYVQSVLRLGGCDYILKSAPYSDMNKALVRAVEMRNKQLLAEYQQKFNLKREIALKEKFMRAILDGTVPSTRANIEKIAGMIGIALTADMSFCLILHDIKRWEEILKNWSKIDIEFCIKNIVRELFETPDHNTPLIFPVYGKYYTTIIDFAGKGLLMEDISSKCRHLNQVFKRLSGYGIISYIGHPCRIDELTETIAALLELSKKESGLEGAVILQDAVIEEKVGSYSELIDECYRSLLKRDQNLLEKCVERLLERLNLGNEFHYNEMEEFVRSYTQMVFAALEIRNVNYKLLAVNQEFKEMEKKALWGPASLKSYIQYLNYAVLDMMNRTGNEQNVISAVKAYVRKHMNEEISREELAKLVFLSEDYLSRIFKKRENISLTQFVTNEKIKHAKKLLETPGISVTMAAEGIGIYNFPYFSKMFKRETGVSPSEYKKMCLKSESE